MTLNPAQPLIDVLLGEALHTNNPPSALQGLDLLLGSLVLALFETSCTLVRFKQFAPVMVSRAGSSPISKLKLPLKDHLNLGLDK